MKDLEIRGEKVSNLLFKSKIPSTDYKTVYIAKQEYDKTFSCFRFDIFDYEKINGNNYEIKGWRWISKNKKEIFSIDSVELLELNKVFSSKIDVQRYTTWLKLSGYTVEEIDIGEPAKVIGSVNPKDYYKENPLIKDNKNEKR